MLDIRFTQHVSHCLSFLYTFNPHHDPTKEILMELRLERLSVLPKATQWSVEELRCRCSRSPGAHKTDPASYCLSRSSLEPWLITWCSLPKVTVLVTVEPNLSPSCQVRLWEFSGQELGNDKRAVPNWKWNWVPLRDIELHFGGSACVLKRRRKIIIEGQLCALRGSNVSHTYLVLLLFRWRNWGWEG